MLLQDLGGTKEKSSGGKCSIEIEGDRKFRAISDCSGRRLILLLKKRGPDENRGALSIAKNRGKKNHVPDLEPLRERNVVIGQSKDFE